MIANELEMPELLVPPTASVLCATGMLLGDLRHDYVRSYVCRFGDLDLDRLRSLVGEMTGEGAALLRHEGIDSGRIEHQVIQLDLRYVKQYHEVTVPVSAESWSRRATPRRSRRPSIASTIGSTATSSPPRARSSS